VPVTVEWHPTLPVLLTVYRGILSAADYHTMRAQQRAALDRDPKQVVLLADLQMMMGFPEADMLDLEDSLLMHPQVMGMVVILDDGLYDRLARPRQAHEGLCSSVCFFKDHDAALNQAESWLHSEAAKLYSPS
jgi:hypothetical protein